jgi:primosomal protein N' (replication factor Y)
MPAAGGPAGEAPEAAPAIVAVALNVPLRRTFDYRLTPEQALHAQPGCRVIVPFGNRVRSGIVVALKTASDLPTERLKTVQQVTAGPSLLPGELLAFARWMADYYFCGWGEVLEAALPSGLAVRFRTHFRPKAPPAPEALTRLSPAMREFLRSHDEWEQAQWERAAASPEDVAWLWRQARPGGLLAMHQEFAGTRSRPRTENWVKLGRAAPPTGERRRNPLRESRKEQVLRLLREEGDLPVARLKALMPNPAAALRVLAAEGAVTIYPRRGPSRSPFGPPPPAQPFLTLNAAQQTASDAVHEALRAGAYQAFLLQGVTGSGKTEVYLHAVRETLALGRTCLLLVPEIALTADIVNRFRARFGDRVAVLHSGMGEGERFDEWNRVREGRASIVIGARSAVFAPLADIGLVIVDEEHDGSYKQDETPRYHGRDAAMLRASRVNAVVLLGSATPSVEALRNLALGKLKRLLLPQRVENRPLPGVELLDLRTTPRQAGSAWFTRRLVEAVRETLGRGEQAMLFLNRRGFAQLVRCTACGTPVTCEHCSIALTWHQAEGRMRCHRCDYARPVPERCPACNERALKVIGVGTERIEQELLVMFPQARVVRMDSDSLRRKGELERIMSAIRRRDYDLIIGTQILSKGHDFPHITLVGAVLADVSLNLPDFRAPERTFQMLTQMAGRAGRGDLPGQVLVQTYSADHYSLVHVSTHDTEGFTTRELAIRAAAGTPPFSSHVLLWVLSENDRAAQRAARELTAALSAAAAALPGAAARGVAVAGPAEAPIKRINKRYRWMIQLRAPTVGPLHATLRAVLDAADFRVPAGVRIAVDVDPYTVF